MVQGEEHIGKKFNRLTAIRYSHRDSNNRIRFEFKCDCGKITFLRMSLVVMGAIKSCGCLKSERLRKQRKIFPIKKTFKKEYRCWSAIKNRCDNVNNDSFERYGGRGIKVCDRWASSFENFLTDMGRAPSPKHSIDRMDNNGNYEPSNCRWATIGEQNDNKSSIVMIEYQGVTKTLATWCRELQVKASMVHNRIRDGWNPTTALITPKLPNGKRLNNTSL